MTIAVAGEQIPDAGDGGVDEDAPGDAERPPDAEADAPEDAG